MALFRSRKTVGKPGEWFYCVKHHKVEEGPECASRYRMGPYATEAEAANAMGTVAERNEKWDAADEDPPGPGGA